MENPDGMATSREFRRGDEDVGFGAGERSESFVDVENVHQFHGGASLHAHAIRPTRMCVKGCALEKYRRLPDSLLPRAAPKVAASYYATTKDYSQRTSFHQ